MEDFRKKFACDSISNLREFLSEIDEKHFISDELKQRLFRAFHTIKGTSQVLGLKVAAQIAHKLEDSIANNKPDSEHLRKEINKLIEVLEGKCLANESDSTEAKEERIEPEILPNELMQRLSQQEIKRLNRAILENKNILLVNKNFQVETFVIEFKEFQSKLNSYAEIIASFCQRNPKTLVFQFVLSTDKKVKEIEGLEIEKFFDSKLLLLINHLIAHGKRIASDRGKEIEFEFCGHSVEFSEKLFDLVFEILLHLIRNSVDHGIVKQGKIKIEVEQISDKLILRLSDNGQGIDLLKVRKRAVEKGIICNETELSEQELLDLIFIHGFSTSDEVSEVSGRGVGLDVIKQKIAEKGGKIKLRTGPEGTSFEITLKTDSASL